MNTPTDTELVDRIDALIEKLKMTDANVRYDFGVFGMRATGVTFRAALEELERQLVKKRLAGGKIG